MADLAPDRLRWELTTVACMYGGYAGLVLCRTTVSIASPEMINDAALGLDESGFGALLGWGAAGALAGKLLNGALADVLGGRRLFLLAMSLMGAATVMFGASSAHVLFMLMNFLAQLTKAAGWPAMAKIIGAWFDAARHGRVWGVISTSSRAGSVVSSFFLGGLLVYLPWRCLFYAAGVVTALIVGLNFILLKDSPAQVGLAPSDPEPTQGGEPWLELLSWEKTLGAALIHFAKNRRVQLICLAMMAMTIQMEFLSFLPLYFQQNFAIESGPAGMASAAFPAGSFISVLAGGLLYGQADHGWADTSIGWPAGGRAGIHCLDSLHAGTAVELVDRVGCLRGCDLHLRTSGIACLLHSHECVLHSVWARPIGGADRSNRCVRLWRHHGLCSPGRHRDQGPGMAGVLHDSRGHLRYCTVVRHGVSYRGASRQLPGPLNWRLCFSTLSS